MIKKTHLRQHADPLNQQAEPERSLNSRADLMLKYKVMINQHVFLFPQSLAMDLECF